MNSFGGSPLLPPGMHPMDMMGYGSHTINFNPRPNLAAMPTYYSDAFQNGGNQQAAHLLRQTPINYTPL